MSNKTQLQLNNETLGSILSNVLGLPSQESLKQGAYVWKKLTAQGGDFVDFVVSDSETAYPDGDVHTDGYWYTKFDPTTLLAENIREGISIWGVLGTMIEGITPEMIGCTKIAADKIVCSANTALSKGINHSLGEVPETALLYTKATGLIVRANDKCILSAYINKPTGGVLHGGADSVYWNNIQGRATQNITAVSGSATDTKVSIDNPNLFLKAGVEYILITMA